jgi:hypothetical protein
MRVSTASTRSPVSTGRCARSRPEALSLPELSKRSLSGDRPAGWPFLATFSEYVETIAVIGQAVRGDALGRMLTSSNDRARDRISRAQFGEYRIGRSIDAILCRGNPQLLFGINGMTRLRQRIPPRGLPSGVSARSSPMARAPMDGAFPRECRSRCARYGCPAMVAYPSFSFN